MSRNPARVALVGLIGTILASLVIAPVAAGTLRVTGTLVLPADVAGPGPKAVAVVTLIDATNTSDSGNVIGQQRIDGIGAVPVAFAVPFEGDTIDKGHAYALFATIVDGGDVWQNATGVPVITGGPSEGLKVSLTPQPAGDATITGHLVRPDQTTLGPEAVAIAALIKEETGTLVSRQVLPTVEGNPPAFTISFDTTLLDPAATYVVKAAIVDGATVWQSEGGVPAISGGATTGQVTVPLALTTAQLPVASSPPTAAPTQSAKPSATATPTEEPSETATPPASPTATPTASPTATPKPTATPTPTPTAVPSASAVPPSGVLTGTLDYPESYELSADAVAGVALVEGKGKVTTSPIVSTQIISPAGQAPIAFRITYDPETIDPAGVYTIQAGIFDGDQAWVTSKGTPVITNGVQSDIAVTLAYRPDVAKGDVTGSVTGVGITLAADASSMAVLIDVDTGLSLGVDLTRPTRLPAPFSIPFAVSDIKADGTYVVQAELTSGSQTWANAAGVPVITGGNPLSGVQVVVAEVAQPTPSQSPTPAPTPAASPPPAPDSGLDGGTLLLPLIVIGGLIAVGGVLLARSKDDEPPKPPASSQAHPDPAVADDTTASGGPTATGDPATAAEASLDPDRP